MIEAEDTSDPALRAANQALAGYKRREASRFASIELRFTDPESGPWEVAAFGSVGLLALLVVLGAWLL